MKTQPNVLVTGASSGIGWAVTEALTARGIRVFGSLRTLILQVNLIDLEKHFAVGANTLRALKVVLVSAGAKNGLHVILEIRESNACSDVWGDD